MATLVTGSSLQRVNLLPLTMAEDCSSCSSDDTVVSVGNEAENQPPDDSECVNGGSTLSFKNLEDHLNALSQGQSSSRLSPSNSSSRSCSSPLFRAENLVNFGYRSGEQLGYHGGSSLCSPTSVQSDGTDSPGSPCSRWISSAKTPSNTSPESSRHQNEVFFRPGTAQDQKTDHQATLKFSIDNILKADFGRSRILDPITIRKSKPPPCKKPVGDGGGFSGEVRRQGTSTCVDNERTSGGPVDLSPRSDRSGDSSKNETSGGKGDQPMLWPAWVYCTRYSDRPSSGRSPRTRRMKKPGTKGTVPEEKRPRTAFSGAQLARLKHEFAENRYLTERRRQQLSSELGLNEAQIKIWFQNKRAKIKKASGQKNPLALQLMAQGLYNHSTIPLTKEEEELEKLQTQGKVA